jgi:2-polyprenyl-3-methyl-5-hydroxy-6-metoxy-1,4-benzoquinol methylase
VTSSVAYTEHQPEDRIDALPCSDCLVCGGPGQLVYQGLQDRAFDAPGFWSFRECLNAACGLVWIDPVPLASDLWKAYRNYYTHADYPQVQIRKDLVRQAFRWIVSKLRTCYLASRYNYCEEPNLVRAVIGRLAYLMPWRRTVWDVAVMFLPNAPAGKFLEIGFGSGELLSTLRGFGWEVQGVDVDPKAVEHGRLKGLEVNLGPLERLRYADGYFDAIAMSHVIEHVHDPSSLLRECYRILKPGGHLTLITPNAQSFLRKLFGSSWFALEPPRHLHIFTLATMRHLLHDCGFSRSEVFTTVRDADGLFVSSRSIRQTGHVKMGSAQPYTEKALGRILQLFEWILAYLDPSAGEELSVIARK